MKKKVDDVKPPVVDVVITTSRNDVSDSPMRRNKKPWIYSV